MLSKEEQLLVDNIYNLNLLELVRSRPLSNEFIVNYILNSDFQLLPEEENINEGFILTWQPHFSRKDVVKNKYFNFEDYM
jgi:hypothetical protein